MKEIIIDKFIYFCYHKQGSKNMTWMQIGNQMKNFEFFNNFVMNPLVIQMRLKEVICAEDEENETVDFFIKYAKFRHN